MAVEARHMNFFPSQILADRDLIKTNQPIINPYNTQMEYGLPLCPLMAEQLLPFYQPGCDPKTSMNKADSGLTYNVNNNTAPTRKRLRDSINDLDAYNDSVSQKHRISSADGDVLFQLQQQQSDINRLIAEHTEKIRLDLEERRKSQLRTLVSSIQDQVVKKIKEKDEEIQRMGKLNWVLQERVKSLYVENQIWRDLAQTNEATANSLRSNLEQVLAHVSSEDNNNNHRHVSGGGGGGGGCDNMADDAESSCGSSDHGREQEKEKEVGTGWQSRRGAGAQDGGVAVAVGGGGGGSGKGRLCRKCGERESSVLLLPCRHLCLCTMCGSTLLGTCPVCDSVMNASVHVNMS